MCLFIFFFFFFLNLEVNLRNNEQDDVVAAKLTILKKKLNEVGINGDSCTPGQHDHLLCPQVRVQGFLFDHSFSLS